MAQARVTIGEVNAHVPFTFGDTIVPADRLTAVVHDDRLPVAVERRAPIAEDEAIARHVAALIPDGATIQFGIGGTPDAVLGHLHDKRDLGRPLRPRQRRVRRPRRGRRHHQRPQGDRPRRHRRRRPPRDVADWRRGPTATRRCSMRSVEYTHDAHVLGGSDRCSPINSAIEVDLTGRSTASRRPGSTSGRSAARGRSPAPRSTSASGRSIVALPSTARDGTISRIVHRLADGIVSTARADADLIVTEHGVADLRGASLTERAARSAGDRRPPPSRDLAAPLGG